MPLRLSLLGAPHVVRVADEPVIPLAPRDAAVLAWLVLVGPTTRAQLAALLWPDSSDEQARNSLRQRLFQLRRQIGADLVTGTATLEVAPDVAHDLDSGTSLLGDLVLSECPSLNAWLQAMRERRARQQRVALIERLDALEATEDWHGALPLAESLVDLEPLSEHAHRRVMQLHYLRGDRAAALLAFDRLERRLKDDVGTRPDAASLALLHTIEQSRPLEAGAARPARVVPTSLMRPPRLVGREVEFERVRQILGEGRAVALVGEAGIGKSRLLQALTQDRDDVTIWSGRPGDAITPYATLARGLGTLLRSMPRETATNLPHDVRADLARVVPELGDAQMPIRSPRGVPVSAVKRVLRSARPYGGTFVLDDLHFADEASVELLQQCLDDEDRVQWRVIVTMRPTSCSPQTLRWVQALATAGELVSITLPPLGADALGCLIDSLEVPGLAGEELAAALHQRTGGNPLFALETLKLAWGESASIDAMRLPRPDSVAQLIEQQVALLSEPAVAVARVAALAGVDFSLELAEAVLDRHAVELADAWRELERHQVMRGEGFAHDLVAESVRSAVPDAIGRVLHERIANWLESHGGEPSRLALHHEAAGRGDLAVPELRAAAERAHLALREPERIDFLLHAAELARARGERELEFVCLREAIQAHIGYVRDDSRLPLIDRLDALVSGPRERALALRVRATFEGNLGRWKQAVPLAESALEAALESGDEEVQVSARQTLGTAYSMTGACDQALTTLLSIRRWMENTAPNTERREYVGNLAVVMDNAGRLDEALRVHQAVIADIERTDEYAQRVTNLGNLAVNRLAAGDVAAAREHLAVAQQLATTHALGGTRGAFIALLQARCARAIGRYGEALDRFEQARSGKGVPSVLEAVVRMHEAMCWLDLGAHDRAAQALQETLREGMAPRYRAPALLIRARLARALGQRGDGYVEEAQRVMPRGGWFDIQFTVRTEAALLEPPRQALERLVAIVSESQAMGFRGAALTARLRACEVAAEVEPARGARLARQAMLAGAHIEAEWLPRVERWLHPALALRAAGEHDEADEVARMGAAWLRDAANDVPERWREGFLMRADASRQMLALVS